MLSTVLGLICLSAQAAPPADAALEQFGKLPVRFNGRIITFDAAARHLLRGLSGRDTYFDEDLREHSAVDWLLDVAARRDADFQSRVLLIEDPKLLELCRIEPRQGPPSVRNRYGIDELLPAISDLEGQQQRLGALPKDEWTDFDRAAADLIRRLADYIALRQSFDAPRNREIDELRDCMQRADRIGNEVFPAVVPPKSSSNQWTSYAYAAVEKAVIEASQSEDFKPNPAAARLSEIFAAHHERDDPRFAKAVTAYADYVKQKSVSQAPFDFIVPEGWKELGVSIANRAAYYSDALTLGAAVALFSIDEGTNSCTLRVNYLPGESAPVQHFVNNWRLSMGLAPLAGDELQPTFKSVRVDTVDGWYAEILGSETLPGGRQRLLATILKRKGDTLVVSLSGDAGLVEKNRDKYRSFVESLKLAGVDELIAWFDIRDGDSIADLSNLRTLIAIRPDRPRTWIFDFTGSGEFSQEARDEFLKFVDAFPAADAQGMTFEQLNWKPPEAWQAEQAEDGAFAAFWLGSGEQRSLLNVLALSDFRATSESALINQRRMDLHRSPLTEDELKRHVMTVKLKDRNARLAEIILKEPAAKSGEK
jgi:hypothetical protein